MINSLDLNKYIELYQDFLHPNPNINSQAFLILKKEFEVKFMNNLLANLKEEDLFIRRKSILALGRFGEKALKSIVQLYMDTNNKTVKVSCLKTIIKVVVNFNLEELTQDEMLVVDLALKDSSPEMILTVISLLRQLGRTGRNILMKTCRDKDLLRAKASISALLEMKDHTIDDLFEDLLNDKSIDQMIKEDILRDKII
ncbi:putative bilin biosynthesis protein cpeZ [Prochlorococcus marinus str. NATL2A]|uniref:Bilin biosynthesis protein cpeZ n=1 Tax=Prochlorococcus marinus (strain NATL2A) TaxID=59920 RepID=Q46H71_PROMT|nr:glycosyl transferase [Prochlorococcus marinus]AAZ59161.1 putative bilin biosynthesis protein cpeZ [Prochlorococcus marinus str. NATL2A]